MKKTAKIALLEKSHDELLKNIATLKKQLVESKMKLHMGELKDTSVIHRLKSEIAFCLQTLQTKAKIK